MAKMKDKVGASGFLSFYCKFVFIVIFFLLERSSVLAQTYCEDKPKILFYRRGEAELVSSDGENSENHVVVSNLNKELLACVSSRNVEWTYEGEGEPSKFQESSNVDIQKYEDGSISYCLTSQITFYNKQSDTELSKHTGRYICREIGNNTNTASVYVYASRKNSPTFLHSRKTVALPLNQANITLVTTAQRASGKDSNVSRHFTIPCATTRPTTGSVKLLKKGKNNVFSSYVGAAHEFDPRYGFHVNVKTTNLNDLSEFYGEYKCVSTAASRRASDESSAPVEDFVLFTIFKGKSLKIFPPVSEVYTSGMLNLTCESEEPVIMKELLPPSAQDIYSYLDEDDYARDRSDDIIETTEKTEQTSHIANYMELAPAPGRTGEIQCLTEKDSKILHTWKYRIIRKRADKLSGIKFNKRESSFTCKSKLGAPGKLSFISCRTPSECRINKVCLTKSESCRGYSNSTKAFCERKSHFCGKIFYKGGSGLIRCIGEGIDEIRGFTDEAADLAVRMGFGKLKASETALLQVVAVDKKEDANHNAPEQVTLTQQEEINRISEGDRVNVTLRLGYYYFLYPVQWAVKFRNGSTSQLNPDPQTLQVDKLTRTVHASLDLPYTSATILRPTSSSTSKPQQPQISEIMALNVLIPLRSSTEPSWKTISLPITIYGKVGLKRLPTEPESEEAEQIPQTGNKNISGGDQTAAATLNADVTATEASNIEADDEDEESDDDMLAEKTSSISINNPVVDESPLVGNAVKSQPTDDDDIKDGEMKKVGDDENKDAEATTSLPVVDSEAVTSNKLKNHVVFVNTPEVDEVVQSQPDENITKKLIDTVDHVSESETILARSGLLDEAFDEVKDDEVTTLRAPAARLLIEEGEDAIKIESEIETTTVS